MPLAKNPTLIHRKLANRSNAQVSREPLIITGQSLQAISKSLDRLDCQQGKCRALKGDGRSKPKTHLESTRRKSKPGMLLIAKSLHPKTRNVIDNYRRYADLARPSLEARGRRVRRVRTEDPTRPWRFRGTMNIENEGESHDVVENKG